MSPYDSISALERARSLAEEVAGLLDLELPQVAIEKGVESGTPRAWYLIGLIGGKEVGKSALVNALAGREIATVSAFGPGTEKVLAYVHSDRSESVRDYLRATLGDRFEMVEHNVEKLGRQVLLDLPDMDSHFSEHVELTRKMVRLMEYPIWIGSVEKYADAEPARLLAQVARGNAPENFIFCLNKVDQARRAGGESAIREIGEDYAQRIQRSLELGSLPRVHLISALFPDDGDLPALRKELGRDKSTEEVDRSRELAVERRRHSLLAWIEKTNLEERVERLERFLSSAETELAERVGGPLYGEAIPRIEADRTQRADLSHRVHRHRSERWPFVNLLDVALGSLARLFQWRSPLMEATDTDRLEPLVEKELSRGTPNLTLRLETAFAHVQASQPELFNRLSSLGLERYRDSGRAIRELRTAFLTVLETRETKTIERLLGSSNVWGRSWRLIVTCGAVLWFPFAQPILLAYLSEEGLDSIPLALVSLFGVSHLLQSAALLAIYFVLLWTFLRWSAGRKVERLFACWREPENAPSETNLYAAAGAWLSGLLEPVWDYRERLDRLKKEYEELVELSGEGKVV